jgi:hypothetical protein
LKYIDTINFVFKILMLISAIITSFNLYKIEKKSLFQRFLFLTIILSIIDLCSNFYFINYLKSEKTFLVFANINQYIFYLFEIITLILFYKELNGRNKNKLNTIVISILSISLTTLLFQLSNIDYTFFTLTLIIIFELLFINFSFFYFVTQNLEEEYNSELKKLVIINYGFFIFINFTTPFYFMNIYLAKQNTAVPDLNFITYIGYIMLYTTIIKSLKWKI